MAVFADPAGLYGPEPDYEDWLAGSTGKLNFGFVYEQKLFSQYKEVGMIPTGFTPAGASNTAADLELWAPKYTANNAPTTGARIKIEVKLDANADYGQSSLDHNGGSWVLKGSNTSEAQEMRRLLNGMNVIQDINRSWPGKPNLFNYNKSSEVPGFEKQADYVKYKSSFITGPGFARAFASYYSSKGVNYIQIGGLGLYSLGSDPNNLAQLGVTPFLQSGATMKLRTRIKGSQSKGTYRFSTALLMDKAPRPSGCNLDDNSVVERMRWDGVYCKNAPESLKKQRGAM